MAEVGNKQLWRSALWPDRLRLRVMHNAPDSHKTKSQQAPKKGRIPTIIVPDWPSPHEFHGESQYPLKRGPGPGGETKHPARAAIRFGDGPDHTIKFRLRKFPHGLLTSCRNVVVPSNPPRAHHRYRTPGAASCLPADPVVTASPCLPFRGPALAHPARPPWG